VNLTVESFSGIGLTSPVMSFVLLGTRCHNNDLGNKFVVNLRGRPVFIKEKSTSKKESDNREERKYSSSLSASDDM
jgi:hypothetical protein